MNIRCHTLGLLEDDKSIKIEVAVEVLDEMIPGGHLDRRKLLQETNNSLKDIKTMLADDIKDRSHQECPVCRTSVECPVCSEEVRRPMRLTQCSQGHVICDECLAALRASDNKNKNCVLCKERRKKKRKTFKREFYLEKCITFFSFQNLP